MIYLSAGHYNLDPGAVANGYKESQLTIELRGLINAQLTTKGYAFINDKDTESLSQYIARIKPGSGSVICEPHWNSSASTDSTGVEVFVPDQANATNKAIATKMVQGLAEILGIPNRGVKTPKQSKRGTLAILNTKAGISFLPEICFMNNPKDLAAYLNNKNAVAKHIADCLIEAEKAFT